MWLTNTMQATLIHSSRPDRLVDPHTVHGAAPLGAHEACVADRQAQIDTRPASHDGSWPRDAFNAPDVSSAPPSRRTRGCSARSARHDPHIGPRLEHIGASPAGAQTIAAAKLPKPVS